MSDMRRLLVFLALLSAPLTAGEMPVFPPRLEVSRRAADPAIASAGDEFLVVWADRGTGGTHRIRAARVRRDGTPLDSPATLLAEDAIFHSAAYAGNRYLAVWSPDVRFTDGALLERGGRIVRRLRWSYPRSYGRVYGAGNRFLMVWPEKKATLLDTGGDEVVTLTLPGTIAAATADGDGFVIASLDDNALNPCVVKPCLARHFLTRIDRNGVVVAQRELELTRPDKGGLMSYAIAAGGGMLALVYSEYSATGLTHLPMNVTACLIDGGLRQIGQTFVVHPASPWSAPTVLWTGAELIVSFDAQAGAMAMRIGSDAFARRIGDRSKTIATTQDGELFVIDESFGLRGSFQRTLDDTAIRFTISTAPADQSRPSIATDGESVLVAATDDFGAGRVAIVADGESREVTLDSYLPSAPRVTFDGSNYVVIWEGTYAQFFSRRGFPLSRATSVGSGIAAVWSGSLFYVVESAAGELRVYRVTREGTRLDPVSLPIAQAAANEFFLVDAVVAHGDDVFVVFRRSASLGFVTAPVEVVRASPPSGFVSANFAPASGARIAVAGNGALLLWTAYNEKFETRVYAQPLETTALMATTPKPLLVADRTPGNINVIWDGDAYVAVWNERTAIRGARITPPGGVAPFDVTCDDAVVWSGAVAAANGTTAFAFVRQESGVERVFLSWSKLPRRRAVR